MAFRQAGIGDLDEAGTLLQILDGAAAGIAHRGLHAADQLVNDILGRPLERHLAFDTLGHQLHLVLDVGLEIAVGAAARHRADAAHAAIALIGAALIQEGFARRFGRARQQRADHDAAGARSQRLGDVTRRAQTAVGDHRHAMLVRFIGRIHDGGQLRHAHAGDDAGGADGAGADADLHAVRAGVDQRLGRFGGGDIAGHDLDMVGQLLDRFHRDRDLLAVAMGGVDDDQVAFRVDQRLAALQPLVAHGRCGGDAQPARRILGRLRIGDGLLDILDGDQAHAVIIIVHHQQLLDPAGMQQAHRLILADAGLDRRQIVLGHQFADRLAGVLGKAGIAMGQDADQLAVRFDDRNAADPVALHQHLRVGQRRGRQDGDGIDDHAAFEALDRADRIGLFLDRQVTVQHADAAQLRHDDRHVGLGHRVHRRRQDRDVQLDRLGHMGGRVRLAGQHIGFGGLQQHVVKGEAKADVHVKATFCCAGRAEGNRTAGDSWRPM